MSRGITLEDMVKLKKKLEEDHTKQIYNFYQEYIDLHGEVSPSKLHDIRVTEYMCEYFKYIGWMK